MPVCHCCLLNLMQGSYEDYIAADEEVKQLLSDITQLVDDNAEECKVRLCVCSTGRQMQWNP